LASRLKSVLPLSLTRSSPVIEWQIEGRDAASQYMEVDVDATMGAVLNVDR
jgi:hypothetical protein